MIPNSIGYRANDLDIFLRFRSVLTRYKKTEFSYKGYLHQKCKSVVPEKEIVSRLKLPAPIAAVRWGDNDEIFTGYYDYSTKKNRMLLSICNQAKALEYSLHAEHNADDVIKALGEVFKDLVWTEPPNEKVQVAFSQWDSGQVSSRNELLKCPNWDEIKGNYLQKDKLDSIINLKDPWKYGKIIILHGKPGCGKTYFIRALMQAWKPIFNFSVIGDPEEFARNPNYYFSVASDNRDNDWDGLIEEDGAYMAKDPKKPATVGRNLFIIEDAADLILEESRQIHYDKIGKLLNITDGLLGQGREDIIFLTFNEDIKDIDPAFLRPGRCIADLEISSFDIEAANAWLKAKGSPYNVESPATLAELYNILLTGGTQNVPTSRPKFGFGGA